MAEKATLNAENLPKLIEALGLSPDAPLADVMAALRAIVMAEEGEPEQTSETPPEEMADDAPPPEEDDEKKPEDGAAAMAAAGRLFAMTGKPNFSEAIDEVDTWRKSHLALEAGKAKLAKDREALEAAERKTLYARLVELRAETPATLWRDPLAKTKVAVDRLAKEPLPELRARVKALGEGKPRSDPKPPTDSASESGAKTLRFSTRLGDVDLAESEVDSVRAKAKRNGTDGDAAVQKYAEIKLRQQGASGARSED